jgi:hypothetical protein
MKLFQMHFHRHTLRSLLIGTGFLWHAFFSLFGALLGGKIYAARQIHNTIWLNSLEAYFLKQLHSHMNTMSFTLILIGLTLFPSRKSPLWQTLSICFVLCALPLFALGLIGQALDLGSGALIFSSLGGFLYVTGLLIWGACHVYRCSSTHIHR